jgi:hypothetical protein
MHTPARAGVIYNSFLPEDTYSGNRGDFGWRGGTDYYEEAAAFMVPYDCSLTTIDIALGYENGPNAMTVSLFSDNAGVPGGQMETFLLTNVVQPMVTHGSIITVNSTLHPILTGVTQYWIEAEVVDPTATDMTWFHATSPQPGTTRAYSFSGGPWVLDNSDMAFRVSADPVPEPSVFMLSGIGLLALMTAASRRSRAIGALRQRAPTNCTSTISRYGHVACKYSGVCHGQCEPGSGLAHANWVASLWVCCSVWSGAMGYEPEESPWTPVDDAPFLFIRTTRVARNRGSPEEDGWRI